MRRLPLILLVLALPTMAQAYRIERVVGDRVLVVAEGSESPPGRGRQMIAVDQNGRKVAWLEVRASRDSRVSTKLLRGEPGVGQKVELIEEEGIFRRSTLSWGVSILALSSKVIARPSPETEIRMSGEGTGAGLLLDWTYYLPFRLRLAAHYLPLAATGRSASPICAGTRQCVIRNEYLAMSAHAQLLLGPDRLQFFLGGGFGTQIPTGKDSNLLSSSDAGPFPTVEASAGLVFRPRGPVRLGLGVNSFLYQGSSSLSVEQHALSVQIIRPF